MNKFVEKRIEEHVSVFEKFKRDEKLNAIIIEIAERISVLMVNKGQLFLCGNGGSASDAEHIAAEFVGRFYKERPGMNAEALGTNTAVITSVGNDYGYDEVFARQMEAKANAGDMLIGISTSGKSPNVIKALEYAKNNGITTVMLMGEYERPGLEGICDYIIKVPSVVTPRIQEMHIFIGHVIAEYVESKIYKE